MANKAVELSGNDLNILNRNLGLKIMILCSMRGVDDIHDLFREALNLRDSIRNLEFGAQIDELRTVYEVDKLTAENELNRIQKIRNRNYFLFALGGCILLTLVLGIWIYYSRAMVRKNRALFLKIKEQDRLAEELEAIIMRYEQSAQPALENDSNQTGSELHGNFQQQKLVYRLRDYLLQNHRYTQPHIDSDELAAALATNRTTLYKAIKAVTEKSLQEFIQSLRMEEARRLLESSPELSIDNIIFDCGFSSRSAFYRQFNEQYNISPTAYRKLATNGK
jgi:AraC-like DNA-binding protein